MALESFGGGNSIEDRLKQIPFEQKVEIERQTARHEIATLREHADSLERALETVAVERAKGIKGIPYSYEMKQGPYKDWDDWKDLGK